MVGFYVFGREKEGVLYQILILNLCNTKFPALLLGQFFRVNATLYSWKYSIRVPSNGTPPGRGIKTPSVRYCLHICRRGLVISKPTLGRILGTALLAD